MKINLNDQQCRQFVDFAAAVDKDDFAKLGAGSHVVKKTEFDFYGNSRRDGHGHLRDGQRARPHYAVRRDGVGGDVAHFGGTAFPRRKLVPPK